ncbi:MAG: T9SS type A sorting domain-containing protein [Chitinophagaceae bacterium]|nr:T9SS type A sorting domain-containing protein [Chitinophagaceae bacterium]
MKPLSTLKLFALSFSVILFSCQVFAQQKFTASPVSSPSARNLSSHFTRYSLFSIHTQAIATYAKGNKGKETAFELELPGLTSWRFSIAEHDILSKDYKLIINGPQGKTILPRPACMTYAGYLSDVAKSKVRLTLDNDIIYGIIKNGDVEYFIEPLRYFDQQASPDVYVVYDTKDAKTDAGLTCGVQETTHRGNSLQRVTAGTNCVQTQLAIASDESMFLRYGSALAVQTHNIGVMNNVIWDYVNAQFDDNIEFVIVTQNVSTSSATDQLSPAYTGTNSGTILANFRTWGQAGNFGVTYDLGQFWTTRNIDTDGAGGGAGTIGLAYVGAVCGTFRYHILEDFTGSNPSGSGYLLRVLTSHEIGHNFSCSHDGAGSGFIMAPSVGNTSIWSAASIASVDGYVPGLGCLSSCDAAGTPIVNFISSPEAICTGGTMQLTDRSLQGPTAWNWTMTGGTPASSSVRNPTVSYATSGVKNITLTSSNSGGSGTMFSKNILVSNSPATACANTGASSDAGVKSFSLNNINKITAGASTDGDKYMDFSCTDVTALLANTTYSVSANVGTTTPSNQFNLVQVFIDYNNDGDFADANESVYSSPSCYIGTHTFNITTIASPPVTNQFLRLRVLAKDCVGGINSCYNVTNGQAEDYSVFFASGTLLPVTLTDLSGYHANGVNILNWQTSGEKDNSHFEIERSVNGANFETIGFKNSLSGNSSSVSDYSYTDPLAGGFASYSRFYYRLKIVDISGRAEYSKTITITTRNEKSEMLVSLQPVPFSGSVTATIHLKDAGKVNMQLTDMTGRILYRNEKTLAGGIHTVSYNGLDKLARGVYIIRITGDNESISRLVEKQ